MPHEPVRKCDVIGLGCSCIDFLGIVPHLPRLDEKIEMIESLQQGGGEVATALVTLARLGTGAAYVGKVGNDPIGTLIKHDFESEGVSTEHLIVEYGKHSLSAVVLVDQASGKRSICEGQPTVSSLRPGEIRAGFIEQGKVLHLDGTEIEAALTAAGRARAAGVTVVLDADVSALGPQIGALIERADIVIASQPFAHQHTGREKAADAVETLRAGGPGTVFVTLGADGGVGYHDGKAVRYNAFEVDVVDTTGAGDVFHGAFIRGLLEGWAMEQIVAFAAAVAAIKCAKLGGRTGIPNMQTARRFLRERGNAFRFETF